MSFFLQDFLQNKDSFQIFSEKNIGDLLIEKSQRILIKNDIIIRGTIINKGYIAFENCSFIIDNGHLDNQGHIFFIPKIENNDEIEKVIKITLDKDIINDFEFTGFFIEYDIINDFNVIIEGPDSSIYWQKEYKIKLGEKIQSPFYFSSDKGFTASSYVKSGDGLYCNPSFLKTKLYKGWKIKIIY